MLTKENLLESCLNAIGDLKDIEPSRINMEDKIFADLGFDSLSFLELIVTLEFEFDKEFDYLAHETDDFSVGVLIQKISEGQDK
ncbi:acyl carrier protein [Cytobacillus oceanisediminis]|uniref:acyl carrier protein n=1 Tax=Cytobacillus oceanisediminis TaxID=665099 RepID=UPI0020792B68|nr:phosphopantetheine-binding protein [Cytobacillus oceanisediminis]USK44105.1 phosphopantetheine-binding protein [Cytobacillus oceanisediminis]